MAIHHILMRKAATEAGFDLEDANSADELTFGISGASLKARVRYNDGA